MPKVAIIFTGGTISMKIDNKMGAAVPALKGQDILKGVSNAEDLTDVEVYNFGMFPGPHMTPNLMLKLYKIIYKYTQQKDITGVIVTHGTDSLEETASFLDGIYDGPKPIVIIGAMKNSSEMAYDGHHNLHDALRVAINKKSCGKGVVLVMANEIHAARDVTKTHTNKLNTFKSPGLGPIGLVDTDKILYYRNISRLPVVKPQAITAKVSLIKSGVGMTGDLIDFCISKKYHGIVIEAMGRGNLPPKMAEAAIRAISQGIVVIICSRCFEGRVLDSYGYEGAAWHLKQAGAIFANKFNGQKARIRAILALSAGLNRDAIESLFLADED